MASSNIVHSSKFPDVEIPNVSITQYVLDSIPASADDNVAMIEGPTGREVTFGQIKSGVRKLGAGLASKYGFGKGSVLALWAPNLPEYAIAFYAVAAVGGTVTTLSALYTADDARHQLQNSKATLLVTVGGMLDKAKEAISDTSVTEIITFDGAEGSTPLSELMDNDGSAFPDVEINPKEDVVVLPYSSGTTGLPKGVMLTHYNLVANLCQIGAEGLIALGPSDCIVALLPLSHIYGMVVVMAFAMRSQARAVTMPRFDAVKFLTHIQQHKITVVHVVPPIVLFLAKHPAVDKFDLSSLREVFCGAAPLGKELSSLVVERLGLEILRQGMGMSELSPASHVSPASGFVLGSCGVLVPNMKCKIVDIDSGETLGPNQEGELWVSGPNVMKGYLNNEEATKTTIDADGFLHTGDVGMVDEEGNFYIIDRVKELVKYKGRQVAPAELEALLVAHDKVADAAVIPGQDAEGQEIPKAYVVVKPDQELTAEEVMAYVAERVAPYKKIRAVEFTNAIPKSGSGKILRRILKAKDREAREAASA